MKVLWLQSMDGLSATFLLSSSDEIDDILFELCLNRWVRFMFIVAFAYV